MSLPESIVVGSYEYFQAHIEMHNIKIAKTMIDKYIGVQRDSCGMSNLMICARVGFITMIPLLIEKEMKLQDNIG